MRDMDGSYMGCGSASYLANIEAEPEARIPCDNKKKQQVQRITTIQQITPLH